MRSILRWFSLLLTPVAIFYIGISLLGSWNQPQIQPRLELYQTNLLLYAAEWQGEEQDSSDMASAGNAILGRTPFQTALEQYQETRQSVQEQLDKLQAQDTGALSQAPNVLSEPLPSPQVRKNVHRLEALLTELDLKLGILQARQGQVDAAQDRWASLIERSKTIEGAPSESLVADKTFVETARVLAGLWDKPPRLLPNAEQQIQKQLSGWFRYQTLTRLYQLQQRQRELAELQMAEQGAIEQAVIKLFIVGSLPVLGALVGLAILAFLVVQWLLQKEQSLLARNGNLAWSTPWDLETILQVFVLGFFFTGQLFLGQILVPLSFGLLGINPATMGGRVQALSIFIIYVLVALGSLSVLYFLLQPFRPLPEGWFRFRWRGSWIVWAVGGYLVALPLVIGVSWLNQQIWESQGGSNPLLPLALEGRDGIALLLFFVTAAIAAPAFEECLFRGFLLPSLTRYLPVWGAIIVSSLFFAIAHLSLSEVLPLTVLGIVLGFVYTRSRNLLAPMLLHGLWNSGTLLGLFLLGSGG